LVLTVSYTDAGFNLKHLQKH